MSESRAIVMRMYFLQYEALPLPDNPMSKDTAGAFVNCWIWAESEAAAMQRATAMIQENSWKILSLEDHCVVTRESYTEQGQDDDDCLEYYEQAVLDHEVYVFHRWPNEPQEDEIVH